MTIGRSLLSLMEHGCARRDTSLSKITSVSVEGLIFDSLCLRGSESTDPEVKSERKLRSQTNRQIYDSGQSR